MLKDIVFVKPLENYQLFIRFEDGVEGVVDVSKMIEFTGVFTPLQNKEYFDKVQVDPEIGTVHWLSEADLDPDVLYAAITNQPIPQYQLTSASIPNH